jgi:hypothetical protein
MGRVLKALVDPIDNRECRGVTPGNGEDVLTLRL